MLKFLQSFFYFGMMVGLGIFAILIYLTWRTYQMRQRYRHIPGPKTKGIIEFFIGNYGEYREALKNGGTIFDKYVEWSQKYGPIFKYQFASKMFVVINETEGIKEILVTKNFPKTPTYMKIGFPFNQRLVGHGLFSETNNQRWKIKRDLFNPVFQRKILNGFIKEFNNKTDLLMERLRSIADGETVIDLAYEINRMALDVITSVALGVNTNTINDPHSELLHLVHKSFEGTYVYISEPLIKLNPKKAKVISEYKSIFKQLRGFIEKIILDRQKEMKDHKLPSTDMLSLILENYRGKELDMEDMIDDFVNMFLAGHETTSNGLSFTFYELAKNPRVLKELKKEVNEKLGAKSTIDEKDIGELKYTGLVFKETIRIWPPAGQVLRLTDADVNICGYHIPKNTIVSASMYLAGRSKRFFSDPLEFKPERFIRDENIDNNNILNYTFFPFSLGPRNCIGQTFAQIEAKILIAKFVQQFDFELDNNKPFLLAHNITIRAKNGINCLLTFSK